MSIAPRLLARLDERLRIVVRPDGSLLGLHVAPSPSGDRWQMCTRRSEDGGATWSDPVSDDELGDPICQASLIRYDAEHLLFSNPNPPVSLERGPRERMTIRLSHDNGESWPAEYVVYEGPSAYSSLTAIQGDRVGILYEKDKDIAFARVPFNHIKKPR